jgi:hypothetical protein
LAVAVSLQAACARFDAGQYDAAREGLRQAEEIAGQLRLRPLPLNVARRQILTAMLVGAGKDRLTEGEKAEQSRLLDEAWQALKGAGQFLSRTVREDPSLRPLRDRPEVRKTLAEWEEEQQFRKEQPGRIQQAREWIRQREYGRAATEADSLASSPHAYQTTRSEAAAVVADCVRAARADEKLTPAERGQKAGEYAAQAARLLRQVREFLEGIRQPTFAQYQELARVNVRLASLVGAGKSELTADEKAERQRLLDRAMEAVRKAVGARFAQPGLLRQDTILEPVIGRPEFQKLLGDLEQRQAAQKEPRERLKKAEELAWYDDHARAAAELSRVVDGKRSDSNLLFQAAGVYSLCAGAAQRDEQLPPAERQQLAGQYAARAVELLRDVQAKGSLVNRAATLRTDVVFAPLKSYEDFQKLLVDLAAKPK